MKKIFTFLVAFLTTVSGAVWGQYKATLDLSNPRAGSGVDYPIWSIWGNLPCFKITENGTYLVTGSSDEVYIEVGADAIGNRVTDVTLVLDNVTMTSSGYNGRGAIWVYDPGNSGIYDEPEVKIQLKGTNRITNSDGDGAAINVNRNAGLIIEDADNLDGILYVSGGVGIGNPDGRIGDIQINGGTVVATGAPGIGGTDLDNITKFTLDGNAFVVASGLNINPNLKNGIFCNSNNGNTTATVYGNVVLNSTYPDNEDYKLTIDNAATLTLGEGYSLPKDRMADIENDKARFKAYELNFIPNYQPKDVPTGSGTSQLSNYYRGKNTSVSGLTTLTCSSGTHNFLGWMNMETNDVSDNTCSTLSTDPTELKRVDIQGVWTQKEKSITISTQKGFEGTTLLLDPENPNITLEPQAGQSWPGKIELNDWTLSGSVSDDDVTAPGQSKDVVCDVKINGTTKTTMTVKFYISTDATQITAASVKSNTEDATYVAESLTDAVLDITTANGNPVEFGEHYTIKSCTFVPTGGSSSETVTDIVNAGTYSNIIIEPVDGMAAIAGGELAVSGTVTVKPCTIEVIPTKGQSMIEGETAEIAFSLDQETPFGQEIAITGSLTLESTPTVGDVKILIGDLKLDDSNGKFKASNYSLQLQDETFLIRDKIEDADVTIEAGVKGDTWEYDGGTYSEGIVEITKGGTPLDEGDDFTVQYISSNSRTLASIKNADTYDVIVTFKGEYAGTVTKTDLITISPKSVTLSGAEYTMSVGEPLELDASKNPDLLKLQGYIQTETPVYQGTITLASDVDITTSGTYQNAFDISNVTLGTEGSFRAGNYTLNKVQSPSGTLIVNVGDITVDIPGAVEDEQNEGCYLYNGMSYALAGISIGESDYTSDDITITYTRNGEAFKDADNRIWNVGSYKANIIINKEGEHKGAQVSVDIEINPTPLYVFFNTPEEIEVGQDLNWDYTMIEFRGVITNMNGNEETPKVDSNCKLKIDGDLDEPGLHSAWITGFKLLENTETDFKPMNYQPVDEDGNILTWDGSVDIKVPGDGNIEITDPYIGGGFYEDYNDLILYESEGATLSSRHDKMRVRDGGSFTVSLKIDEAYAGAEPIVYVKRGRGGDWTPWKLDEVSGYYQIRNVQTDIYVKVMGDGIWVVGNEDITATDARAYAQPNKIVVITPQPTDVQIISMAGAVVATDKVTGQREFANLTEGVYIVRMGETVVKLQVRK